MLADISARIPADSPWGSGRKPRQEKRKRRALTLDTLKKKQIHSHPKHSSTKLSIKQHRLITNSTLNNQR